VKRPAILVLGLDDGPEAAWGPFVLACLPARRFRRVGAVFSPFESGAYRGDLLDSVHRVSAPEADPRRFAADLVRVVTREKAIAVIAGSPRATDALARAAGALRAAGAAVLVPTPERLARLTIPSLIQACRKKRLKCARVLEFPIGVSFAALPLDLRYPVTVVLEGRPPVRCSDPAQVAATSREAPGRVILVDRNPDLVFESAVVCDARGRVRSHAGARVIAADARGRPWMAVTVDDPELRAAAVRVAAALGVVGAIVMTFEGGNEYRVADVRPGFPMWVEGAHAAEVPLVLDLLSQAGGKAAAPSGPARAGVLFSQTAEDLPIDLQQPVRLARAAEN
jgi:hypothetical protein